MADHQLYYPVSDTLIGGEAVAAGHVYIE